VTDNLLGRAAALPRKIAEHSSSEVEAARESWPCSYRGPIDRHPGRANDWYVAAFREGGFELLGFRLDRCPRSGSAPTESCEGKSDSRAKTRYQYRR
jgi:hypothetical protein